MSQRWRRELRERLAPARVDMLSRVVPHGWRGRPPAGIVIAAGAWLPLLVFTLVAGTAWGGERPFLADPGTYARFLCAVPLFLGVERMIRARLGAVVTYVEHSEMIAPGDREHFEEVARRFVRWRDAGASEAGLAVVAWTSSLLLARAAVREAGPAWFDDGSGTLAGLTPAGWWYVLISQPIWIFLLARWAWCIGLWARLLDSLSRMKLQLVPTHPDRAGGLGILEMGQQSFVLLIVGVSAILAANLADAMLLEGMPAAAAVPTIAVYLLICILVIVGPLLGFMRPMIPARRRGLVEYGDLGDELFRAFDEKWTPLSGRDQRKLLGGVDPSSLADYGYAYEVARDMRIVPFSRKGLLSIVAAALAPFLPLLLLKYSTTEILERLLGILG